MNFKVGLTLFMTLRRWYCIIITVTFEIALTKIMTPKNNDDFTCRYDLVYDSKVHVDL